MSLIDYELDGLLKNYGYQPTIRNNNDSLYVHKNTKLRYESN